MPVWQDNCRWAAGNPHRSPLLLYAESGCCKTFTFTNAEVLRGRLDQLDDAVRIASLIFL